MATPPVDWTPPPAVGPGWSCTPSVAPQARRFASKPPLLYTLKWEAKSVAAVLEAPEDLIRGQAVNVGSDAQNYRIRDLASMLSALSGCAVEIAEGSAADARSYRVDFSKLGRLLPHLTSDWDAERGGRELLDDYRRYELAREELDGDRYIRLGRLKRLLAAGSVDAQLRWLNGDPTSE